MSDVEKRLLEAGIVLPTVPAPIASYLPAIAVGRLVFVSGQGPIVDGQPVYRGRVGAGVTEEQARDAARLCAINTIATLK